MSELAARRASWQGRPGLLQRVWGFDSRHPLWWDIGPVAFLTLTMLVGVAASPVQRHPTWLIILLCLSLLVPLVWRRRRPFLVYAGQMIPILIIFTLWIECSATEMSIGFAFLMALFNVVLRHGIRLLWASAAMAAVLVTVEVTIGPASRSHSDIAAAISSGITLFLLVALIALVIKTRRAYHANEHDRAAREAVAEERARIAREMHDIIGHNLAVINALADGGSYAARTSPERAGEALEAIGSTSRQALGELRRVLSILRAEQDGETADLAPQPGLSELGQLIERVREAGLPVTCEVVGERWELSENQQLAVYRTVQEALTNVFKHASGPPRARVTMDYRGEGLNVVVANTGSVAAASGAFGGLLGLRERAAAFGGTMEAGPQPTGGWRVALWLPRETPTHGSPVSPSEGSPP